MTTESTEQPKDNVTATTTEKTNISPVEKQERIEDHKKTAGHLEEAAKHHLDAAKHHEVGDPKKASHSTTKANGHQLIAIEIQKEIAKKHALKSGL